MRALGKEKIEARRGKSEARCERVREADIRAHAVPLPLLPATCIIFLVRKSKFNLSTMENVFFKSRDIPFCLVISNHPLISDIFAQISPFGFIQ